MVVLSDGKRGFTVLILHGILALVSSACDKEVLMTDVAHRKEHIRLLIFGASNVVYIVDMTLDAPKISCQISNFLGGK